MHRPEIVTPATTLPVSVDEVKLALRFDEDAYLDSEIEAQIKAAVQHYEGWNGVLGIVISEQGVRQSFDRFERDLCLPLGPVKANGMQVTYRNAAGNMATVATSNYSLRFDAAGRASVRFDAGYSFPSDLHESAAVAVNYTAGWEDAPEDIKSAIKLRVRMMLDATDNASSEYLERAETNLISKYRRGWL